MVNKIVIDNKTYYLDEEDKHCRNVILSNMAHPKSVGMN